MEDAMQFNEPFMSEVKIILIAIQFGNQGG